MTDGRHRLAEERSLELHRWIAQRLAAEPAILERARARARQWVRDGTVARRLAEQWLEALDRPLDEIVASLTDGAEHARRLRQSSPFAGAIDPRTRWAVWRRTRERSEAP